MRVLWAIILCSFFVYGESLRVKRAAVANPQRLWSNGIIPYVINDTFPGELQRLFQIAMRHWENYTCISFIPKRPSDKDYVIFTTDRCGCCSYVGRRGGPQIISIGKNCDKFGIVVHELGHVVGHGHEHTRPDRDKFVEIFRDNIQDGQDYNFDKAKPDEIDSRGETYDYHSIMHYARDTFSRSAYLDTILPLKPISGERPKIGQRTRLSSGDIRQTNKMYKCPVVHQTITNGSGVIVPDRNCSICSWRIISSLGERLILNVSTQLIFPETKNMECQQEKSNVIEIRDGYTRKSRLIARMCSSSTPTSISSSSNAVFITLSSTQSLPDLPIVSFQAVCGGSIVGGRGFIQSPRYPEAYPPETACQWNLTVPDGFRVAIKIRYFNLESHNNCSYDRLEVYDGHTITEEHLVTKLCGQIVPKYIVTNTHQMTLRFTSDSSIQKTGFYIEFLKERDECQDGSHNCQEICINRIGDEKFECSCARGHFLNDDRRTCSSTCYGNFSLPSGNFSTLNFPKHYSSNDNCVWEINGQPGHRIILNFTTFDIEGENPDCEHDHVWVAPVSEFGDSEEVKLCGKYSESIVLLSRDEKLKITFKSNAHVEKQGFFATYVLQPDECSRNNGGCEQLCVNVLTDGQLKHECRCQAGFLLGEDGRSCSADDCFYQSYEPHGEIQTPNFPDYYPTNKSCIWHIVTIPGSRIALEFHFFDVEDHYTCRYDHVAVFDGGNQDAGKIGTYCGSTAPMPIISTQNELIIELKSDDTQPRIGFNASYISVCGGQLKADSNIGFVYSHVKYGDRNYSKLTSCSWEIFTESWLQVKLEFIHFDVEKEGSCEYDYVAVYDGLYKRDELLIGRFCGNTLPPVMISSLNGFIIEFRTDDNIEQKGFVFEYSSTVEKVINEPDSKKGDHSRDLIISD